jgi:biopolymer transport protein ExbD
MSRFRESAGESSDDESIDISPLIDVVFILLIFFIVTTVFVEESGVKANRPEPGNAQTSEEDTTIVLTVTEGGQVMHEGKEIGISGVQPLVKRSLRKKQVPVIVRAETHAAVGRMVRVLDEAKLAGAETVSLASRSSS